MIGGMQRSAGWLVVAVGSFAAVSCSDDRDDVPAASQSGGPNVTEQDKDAAADDRDAGARDAGSSVDAAVPSTTSCTLATLATDGTTSLPVQPADFDVTRQAQTWTIDTGCTAPSFSVQLSGGRCPDGDGHELTMTFDVNAIEDGAIHTGNNTVSSDADSLGLSIRYVRPASLSPSGVWGSCTGASGTVIFGDTATPRSGVTLSARYELNLTACDGSSHEALLVTGNFELLVRNSLERFCPDRKL